MKKIVAKVTWRKSDPLGMADLTQTVAESVDVNPTFPNPPIPILDFKVAGSEMSVAYGKRKNGEEAKLTFEEKLNACDANLHEYADYVSTASNGDAVKIASSGFTPTTNVRVPAVKPDGCNPVKAKQEIGGTLNLSVDKVIGADNYVYILYTGNSIPVVIQNEHLIISSSTPVIVVTDGGVRHSVDGLSIGGNYNIIAAAQNTAGIGAFSPPVNAIVI